MRSAILPARARELAIVVALLRQQNGPASLMKGKYNSPATNGSANGAAEELQREVMYLQSRVDFLATSKRVEPVTSDDSAIMHWLEASACDEPSATVSAGLRLLATIVEQPVSTSSSDLACHVLPAVIRASRDAKCEVRVLVFARRLVKMATHDCGEMADVFANQRWLIMVQLMLEKLAHEYGHDVLLILARAVRWVASRAQAGHCESERLHVNRGHTHAASLNNSTKCTNCIHHGILACRLTTV